MFFGKAAAHLRYEIDFSTEYERKQNVSIWLRIAICDDQWLCRRELLVEVANYKDTIE